MRRFTIWMIVACSCLTIAGVVAIAFGESRIVKFGGILSATTAIVLFRYASDKIDRKLDPEGPPWRPAKRRSILGFFLDVVREAISNMAVGCGCLLGILAAALALWGLVSLARRMWEQPLF
jgi:hypothetical protein